MDGFEQHTTDFSFEGVNPRYHNQSYINGDRWSSTNTSEFPPINRPRLVKIVSFWLTLLLVGLICAIIYLAHIREPKTRYYISHGKLAILQEYSTALGNKESMEYKSLTASFCSEMDKSFRSSRLHTNTYRMCIVTNLRPGSVIVTFTLYFDATVDLSDTEVIKTINNSVQHIGSRNMLGNYPIDINGISITTTLTLYEQDPIPFLEPDSDFIIPPTTKQTTPSTAVTSTSTIPATVTTAISPADTTETKKTTTSSTETTKVTTVMTQPITKTTKSTTTMPMTTTAETTTYSHTEAITTLLTSTTEPKTTKTLPSTVTTKLTTTIPPTTTTEGTTSSHTSPTTTITPSLAPTVTTKPTTTIELPTSTQDTKATTFVPTITTEATTSTNLPPSSTTKATTLTPFTSSTEAKTTTIMSLITTEATASLSPTTETKTTTTEAKTTTTFSPSTRTEQTTPTVTSEVTTTATGSPVVTTEGTTTDMPSPETTDVLTTITPIKTAKTTVSNTSPTTKEDTTISTDTTSIMSTTISVKETTEAKTTVSNTSPTTKEDTTISTNTTSNMSTTIPVRETTEALTTIPPTEKTEATISEALQTTKETTSMSSSTTSKTPFPLEKTTEALTTMPLTETTEAEVHSTLPTTETSVVATGMPSTLTGDATTTLSLMETTGTSTLSTNFMSTESHGASTMSEIITTVPSGAMSTNTDISVETTLGSTSVLVKNNTLSSNYTTMPTDSSAESSLDSTTTVETSSIISHTDSDNATAESTVLPTSDISTLISTEETTVTKTTREATTSDDTTEATTTNTTSKDTTREVTTEATTTSTTAAADTDTTREDITTALVTNTTKDVTTENTITRTTSEFTTNVTLNTTTEYTNEPAVTNTTKEYTTEPTVTNTTKEYTTEPTVSNTTKEYTTEPTFSNTTKEYTTEPTFTNTTKEDTTVVNSSGDTTGTSSIATTVSPFTADVMFPSKNILAREDTTLECVITVTDQWEKVTINQETETDFVFLAEFYNNGSVFSQVTTEFLSVVFKQDNETIETIIYINIQNSSSCPSLLHFGCGIIMEDTFKSVITKTSILSITAPLHNVTLDMANVYYSGERLELICRTITDFEYGDVALEVRSPNGSVFREPAPRTQYALTRNSDCSVNFEWKFKSGISLASSLNGSTVWCIASNRLLNTSVSTSQLITVLVSDVSFSQYYVPGSVGKQVMIECKTTTLTSNIAKMAVYKTLNGTNETIASYSSGNTNSRSDILVTFQGGMLTLTFFSLKCSDEGLYICVVTTGSSEVSTPLSLTLQPTVLAGSTAVSLSLNTDIVENYYRYTSEHSCTGEIGYPDAGFLSLSAIHPTSGETVVYNEEVVTDVMKVKDRLVGSDIYSYGVTLAKDFRILVKEDRKVQENCSTIHKVRFFLNVSREWSRGRFSCEIRTKEGRIPTSLQEEQFYVIPSDVCDAYNKTKQVFIDHEKNDNCNTYIQCGDEAPYGKKCSNPKYCVFIGKDYCDECVRAICTEIPTTTAHPVPTTEAARGFSYLDCNSSSVSEGESASIGCHLNSSSFVSLNILKSEFTIASIQVDGSVVISPNYQGKLFAILDLPSLLLVVTINTVTCSDDGIYNVTLQLDSGNVTSTTFKVNMKVKPKNPTLSLNPSLVDGENSLSHSCTGNVGNPPGSLQIQIRRSADSNFTEYSTPRQIKSSSLESAGNCSYIKTLSFSIDLTTESWSNMTIRCVALNTVSLEDDDPVPSSILYTRTSISSEFCENKNKTYYDYHPMGCPFYVWCVTGRPYGQVCAANDLCMNPVSGDCERKK